MQFWNPPHARRKPDYSAEMMRDDFMRCTQNDPQPGMWTVTLSPGELHTIAEALHFFCAHCCTGCGRIGTLVQRKSFKGLWCEHCGVQQPTEGP